MSGEECKTPNDWIMTDYSSTFETSPSSKIDYKNFNEYDKLTSSSADLGFDSKLDIKLIDYTFFLNFHFKKSTIRMVLICDPSCPKKNLLR
jgi:hypothetical protein